MSCPNFHIHRIITFRLLLNKQDLAKIIGKGGHKITQMRSALGVEMKTLDVDENLRLV